MALDKRAGLCYLELREVRMVGIPPDQTYNVENIQIELNYGG